jgi:predicted dehydrogenase
MSIINIGVVGCGHWSPNHVRVFSQLKESRVVACADLDPKRLEAIREQHPQVNVFQDYQEMLKTAAVDAVVVAAPTRVHYPIYPKRNCVSPARGSSSEPKWLIRYE